MLDVLKASLAKEEELSQNLVEVSNFFFFSKFSSGSIDDFPYKPELRGQISSHHFIQILHLAEDGCTLCAESKDILVNSKCQAGFAQIDLNLIRSDSAPISNPGVIGPSHR